MKTSIRRLDSLTHNDTAATKLINDNFEALQQGIEDSLSRTGKTPNFMDAPLDMNMNRIINIADPVDDYDLANKHYVDEAVAGFQEKLDAETEARQNADGALQDNIDAEETRAKAAEKAINDTLDTFGDVVTHNADEFATAAQGAKADTAVQPGELANVATSGDYNDLNNKPTIPTVNNATITLTQGGVTKGSFTLNQSSDGTIELDAGGSTSIPSVYKIISATFAVNSGSATINVADIVENGVLYVPFFVADVQHTLKLECFATYDKSTKLVTIYRNSDDLSSSLTATGVICLVATNDTINTISTGLTNGQDYNQYNRSYSKAEEDNLLSGKQDTISDLSTIRSGASQGATAVQPAELSSYQLISNLVTSVSSASTDSQYPSAKLFYDTCGDIETLINAL